jgi:hypothetical protein
MFYAGTLSYQERYSTNMYTCTLMYTGRHITFPEDLGSATPTHVHIGKVLISTYVIITYPSRFLHNDLLLLFCGKYYTPASSGKVQQHTPVPRTIREKPTAHIVCRRTRTRHIKCLVIPAGFIIV